MYAPKIHPPRGTAHFSVSMNNTCQPCLIVSRHTGEGHTALGYRTFNHLIKFQPQIRSFSSTLSLDLYQHSNGAEQPPACELLAVYKELRICDITFRDTSQFSRFAQHLFGGGGYHQTHKLHTLQLAMRGIIHTQALVDAANTTTEDDKPALPDLKTLTLQRFHLLHAFPALEKVISFQKITNLTLWNCTKPEQLLIGMSTKPQLISLKHLAINFLENEEHVDACLQDLLKISLLQSLHITWVDPGSPSTTLRALKDSPGKSLRCFSLHSANRHRPDCDFLAELELVSQQCIYMEEIGFRIPRGYTDPSIWSRRCKPKTEIWVSRKLVLMNYS